MNQSLSLHPADIAVLIAYAVLQTWIGVRLARHKKDPGDSSSFLLDGRRLTLPAFIACTVEATHSSGKTPSAGFDAPFQCSKSFPPEYVRHTRAPVTCKGLLLKFIYLSSFTFINLQKCRTFMLDP